MDDLIEFIVEFILELLSIPFEDKINKLKGKINNIQNKGLRLLAQAAIILIPISIIVLIIVLLTL